MPKLKDAKDKIKKGDKDTSMITYLRYKKAKAKAGEIYMGYGEWKNRS